jgi:hypothetical protein
MGFSIRPRRGGWSWAAIDPEGRVRDQGDAPTRALAAAFVIRAIARASVQDNPPA